MRYSLQRRIRIVPRMTEPTLPPVITKELLRELGDWRVDKEGRQLAEAGRVQNLSYTGSLLSGTVGNVNARLKLGTGLFGIENQCSCRQARVDGIICAHVGALVYASQQSRGAPGRSRQICRAGISPRDRQPDGRVGGVVAGTSPRRGAAAPCKSFSKPASMVARSGRSARS